MIITQTPFRMSFFGGGTDMESFFRENGGAVLSTTFDKYCYVNVRHLPRFFDYSTELSYSKTERVTCIEDIQHPAIRNAMKMLDIQLYHNDGECYKNKYEPLDLSCVESHLKKYVKEKDLQAYNAALPSEEEINDYAHKMSVYKTITNGGVALKLRVLNKGTAKATDIRISIVFPKDIFVYDIDDIEKMKEPKAPKLPPNPIEKAEERFMSDLNPVYGLLKNSMDGMQPFYSARSLPIIDPAIFNNSNSSVFESISIRDNSIFAECNQLPHKDDTEFDGIYIVPVRKGKFKVSVSLMCSEYIEPKVHDIEFEIV